MFWHRKSKADDSGKAPIYCRMSINGEDEELSIGEKVTSDQWGVKTKKVKGGEDAKRINLKMSELIVELNSIFKEMTKSNAIITPKMLKNKFLGKSIVVQAAEPVNEKFKPTLLQAVDMYITNFEKMVEKDLRSAETLRKWRSTKNKVIEFIREQYKTDDLLLENLEYSFATQFYQYLTVDAKEIVQEPTAKKYIKNIKGVLNVAETTNVINKNPIQKFKCGGDDTDIQPLELVEVDRIWRKEIGIKRLAEVRDAFIFQCFTGFAYQDIYAITIEHIAHYGIDAEPWLIKDRGKTGITEMVPVLPIVAELIEKYKDHGCRKVEGKLIPVNSNFRYNCYLKELAVICGINRDLNTHLARHTFADIMLNVMGFTLAEVGRMLGQKSIRTTQRYAKVRRQLISQNMASKKHVLFTEDGQLKRIAS